MMGFAVLNSTTAPRAGVRFAVFAAAFAAAAFSTGRAAQPAPQDAQEAPPKAVAQALEVTDAPDGDAPVETLLRVEGLFDVALRADGAAIAYFPEADETGLLGRYIHSAGLTAGLGSNPVGLDRGNADAGRIVAVRRVGDKVVLEEENWTYRASADDPREKKAVRESFASSILWAGVIERDAPEGAVAVDISGFLKSDLMGAGEAMADAGEGDYAVDDARSYVDPAGVLAFPDNVEIDARLTLSAKSSGPQAAQTAADGRSVTLTAHHSFVRLPEAGYRPRAFDPRVAAIDVPYYDFSAPLDGEIRGRFARRFRLERADPAAEKSPAKAPIVFYVDPGAPEPIRSALLDGARWWAEAFEAAGYEDAYRVELLPDDAHPMDIRYNVIQWVHRQTRGWSYGFGVHDPRTGEMLKAHVVLGSQRVRQDRMIFEGLAGAGKTGTGEADDPVELALARIRQLAAHEVGHTLGFAHNFAASADDRASVMDYPAPLVRLDADGALDFSEAYGVGVGPWDVFTVRWLYSDVRPETDEEALLEAMVDAAYASGLRFVDDAQGRSAGTAHPYASVWDNGADPVASLEETMRVRAAALGRFGEPVLKPGEATARLVQAIVPIYLYHRYQTVAAAKLIGGVEFRHAEKGDEDATAAPAPAERQRAALAAVLATLDPSALDLPDALLNRLTPPVDFYGGGRGSEFFAGSMGAQFDIFAAADAAAQLSLSALLHPARAMRLVEAERRGDGALSFAELLSAVETQVFASPTAPRETEIARIIQSRFVATLIDAASGEDAAPAPVQSRIDAYLKGFANRLAPRVLEGKSADRAHREWLIGRIDAHLSRAAPAMPASLPRAETPPGSPIGATGAGRARSVREDCWFCDLP